MKTLSRYHRLIFVLIVLLYLLYAGIYIYKTSFTISGQRYYVLFDDAMVSMRYARNLAEGHGLVWNPGGERVEGYSNPLWVIFMAIFHLLPIPASKISLYIQTSGALLLATNLFFVKKIAETLTDNPLISLLVVFLTAFYIPLNNWGLQGMEVCLLTLILNIALWKMLRTLQTNTFSFWPYLLLSIGTLVRIDMAVMLVTALIFFIIADTPHRRQHMTWGISFLVLFLVGQTLFRWFYYGDFLPNTFYLKMTGVPLWYRAGHGFFVFLQSIWVGNWVLFLIPFYLLVTHRDKATILLFALVAAQSFYSVYVGGDSWEDKGGTNRFISTVMPVFFVLFCYALDKIRHALAQKDLLPPKIQDSTQASQWALAIFVFISLFSFNTLLEQDALKKWLLIKRPIFVQGTMHNTEIGLTVDKITTKQAHVAVITAGAIPYISDRYTIDMLGKNDKRVARGKMHIKYNLDALEYDYRPGHNKWDAKYSIGELKPDVVAQTMAGAFDEDAAPYLEGNYTLVYINGDAYYLRNDSHNVLWNTVAELKDAEGKAPKPGAEEE